jgi:hypothetical protein
MSALCQNQTHAPQQFAAAVAGTDEFSRMVSVAQKTPTVRTRSRPEEPQQLAPPIEGEMASAIQYCIRARTVSTLNWLACPIVVGSTA